MSTKKKKSNKRNSSWLEKELASILSRSLQKALKEALKEVEKNHR